MARLHRSVDPFGIGASMNKVAGGWLTHPAELSAALADLARDLQHMQLHAWQTVTGLQPQPHVAAAADDARFADPAWSELPALSILKQFYLLYTRWSQEALFETPGVPAKDRRRAAFWVRQWFNAVAPTNYFFTNPVALRKFYETDGESLRPDSSSGPRTCATATCGWSTVRRSRSARTSPPRRARWYSATN